MKRILLLFSLLAVCIAGLRADHNRTIETDQLPVMAQTFLQQNFPSAKVSRATQESEIIRKSYTVWLNNGIQIEFNKHGEWMEINAHSTTAIPQSLIAVPIADYVKARYPQNSIVGIEKRKGEQTEIELNNGTEIVFNRKYRVIDIDD